MPTDKYTQLRTLERKLLAARTKAAEELANYPRSVQQREAAERRKAIEAAGPEAVAMAVAQGLVTREEAGMPVEAEAAPSAAAHRGKGPA